MARRRITGQLRLFLDVLYTKHKGSSVAAATEAGYPNPIIDGPRVRRKYPDLCERARLAWIETSHMSYDEALERLAIVGRSIAHRDHVRALNIILELHGAKNTLDPGLLRREAMELIKQIATRKTQPLIEAQVLSSTGAVEESIAP